MVEKSKTKSVERLAAISGIGALRPGALQLVVEEGVKAQSVHTALDRIFDVHGCRACGLAGLDVFIRVQDKLVFDRFQDIPGIHDVTLARY